MKRMMLLAAVVAALTFGQAQAQEVPETTATETAATTAAATETTATATPDAAAAGSEAATTTDASAAAAEQAEAERAGVRDELKELLYRQRRSLMIVLAYEPSLFSNEEFLARYPELARFVERHPDVAENPSYYTTAWNLPHQSSTFENIIEPIVILLVCAFFAAVGGWFIRTIIEQKRWNRLSKQQAEVHSKILDRFSNSEELLRYIQSPAGTKFLESAPIPVREAPVRPSSPVSRVILSVQIGVIVAVLALGLLLLGVVFEGESAEGFLALGVVAFCVGGGFIGSAVVSLILSRKLGLWQDAAAPGDVR